MELGKPSALSIGAWIALIAIAIYLIFVATHKSDNETFTRGASKSETTLSPTANYYPLSFGCSPLLRMTEPGGIKYPEPDKQKGKI